MFATSTVTIAQHSTTTATSNTTSTQSSSIINALRHRHECEIPLDTDDIQYGQFDVCSRYRLILLCEKSKLKLYNKSGQLDSKEWGSGFGHGFLKSIFWCESQSLFFILSTCRLYTLSIMKVEEGKQTKYLIGDLVIISQVVANEPCEATDNYMRYITISEKSQHLFLNRAYRCIELWDIKTWKCLEKWPKRTLGYGENDEIRLIDCSEDGSYIVMNIWFNRQTCAIDFRRHDTSLSLLNRFESRVALGFFFKLQVQDMSNVWLVIDDKHTIQALNLDSDRMTEKIETEGLRREGNKSIDGYHHLHMRYFGNDYLLVGMPRPEGRGKLCFFRINQFFDS